MSSDGHWLRTGGTVLTECLGVLQHEHKLCCYLWQSKIHSFKFCCRFLVCFLTLYVNSWFSFWLRAMSDSKNQTTENTEQLFNKFKTGRSHMPSNINASPDQKGYSYSKILSDWNINCKRSKLSKIIYFPFPEETRCNIRMWCHVTRLPAGLQIAAPELTTCGLWFNVISGK